MTGTAEWFLVFFVAVIPIVLIYLTMRGLDKIPPGMWGFVTNFGGQPEKNTPILGPGPFFKMPWQSKYLYYSTPQEVDVPKIKVSIGGETAEEAFVNATVFVQVKGPGAWYAPNHNPYQYAADLTYAAITAHLSGWGAEKLFNADKAEIAEGVTSHLQKEFSGRDPGDKNLETKVRMQIEDIDVPESVLNKSRLVLKAQGQAEASETLSKQEVENYKREKDAQGPDYMHRQELDTLKETIVNSAEAGGVRALSLNFGGLGGGLSNVGTGYLVAREAEKDE